MPDSGFGSIARSRKRGRIGVLLTLLPVLALITITTFATSASAHPEPREGSSEHAHKADQQDRRLQARSANDAPYRVRPAIVVTVVVGVAVVGAVPAWKLHRRR